MPHSIDWIEKYKIEYNWIEHKKSRIEQTATKHCKGIYETFLFSGFQIHMYIFVCVYYVYWYKIMLLL